MSSGTKVNTIDRDKSISLTDIRHNYGLDDFGAHKMIKAFVLINVAASNMQMLFKPVGIDV